MYVGIIILVFISIVLLLGYGKKALNSFRLSSAKAMFLIFLTIMFSLFPDFSVYGVMINLEGIWIMWLGILWWFTRGSIKSKLFNLVGIVGVCVATLLYKNYAADIMDTLYGGLLYPTIIAVAAYITTKGYLASFISAVLGVGFAVVISYFVSQFNVDTLIIGGNSNVMIIGAIGAVLLKEIADILTSLGHKSKRIDSIYEAGKDEEI